MQVLFNQKNMPKLTDEKLELKVELARFVLELRGKGYMVKDIAYIINRDIPQTSRMLSTAKHLTNKKASAKI